MNPNGVSLADVWTDIPPVRHANYKNRKANALPLKLMDRIIALASDPGSVVLDPFGGSGTTYIVAKLTGRQWFGSELESSAIRQRFNSLEPDEATFSNIQKDKNRLFKSGDLNRMRSSEYSLSKQYDLSRST